MKGRIQDLVLDNMLEHVIFYNEEMKILWANKVACGSLGLQPGDLSGKHCYESWYGKAEPCVDCPVKKSLVTGQAEQGNIGTPDGRSWLIKAAPVFSEDGKIDGVVEMATDVTDLKAAEKKNTKANALSELINAAIDPFIVFNARGACVFANRAFEETFQLEQREFIGKPFARIQGFNLQGHEEIARYMPLFNGALMEGRSGPIDLTLMRRDGEMFYLSATAGAIKDEKNITTHLVVVLHDIAPHKNAEDALKEENLALRTALQAFAVVDREGRVSYADGEFLRIWDMPAGNISPGYPVENLLQDRNLALEIMQSADSLGKWEGETVARKGHGVNFKIRLSAEVVDGIPGQLWRIQQLG